MTFLICAIVALGLDAASFMAAWSWLAWPGFGMGLAAWVWAVQMARAYPPIEHRNATLVLGILATFGGFAGIFLSFTLGSLLYGGVMVF